MYSLQVSTYVVQDHGIIGLEFEIAIVVLIYCWAKIIFYSVSCRDWTAASFCTSFVYLQSAPSSFLGSYSCTARRIVAAIVGEAPQWGYRKNKIRSYTVVYKKVHLGKFYTLDVLSGECVVLKIFCGEICWSQCLSSRQLLLGTQIVPSDQHWAALAWRWLGREATPQTFRFFISFPCPACLNSFQAAPIPCCNKLFFFFFFPRNISVVCLVS